MTCITMAETSSWMVLEGQDKRVPFDISEFLPFASAATVQLVLARGKSFFS